MKHTTSFTADGDALLTKIKKPRHADHYSATVFIYGSSFGSGTVTIQLSPDGGTTKITAKDSSGSDVTAAANSSFVLPVAGNGSDSDEFISLYANLNGSTSPSITIDVFDNR